MSVGDAGAAASSARAAVLAKAKARAMTAPLVARVLGALFLLAGILGFIPFFTPPAPFDAEVITLNSGYGLLFGVFPVNVAHDALHVLFGLWGVLSAKHRGAVWYCRVVTVVYAVLVLVGVIPLMNTLFGVAPIYGHDVWLHAVIALIALYGGWGAPSREPMAAFSPDQATVRKG